MPVYTNSWAKKIVTPWSWAVRLFSGCQLDGNARSPMTQYWRKDPYLLCCITVC